MLLQHSIYKDLAKEGVRKNYGVVESDWKTAEDIIKLGVILTDES